MMLDFLRGFITFPLMIGTLIFIVWASYGFKEMSNGPYFGWIAGMFSWIPIAIILLSFIKIKVK